MLELIKCYKYSTTGNTSLSGMQGLYDGILGGEQTWGTKLRYVINDFVYVRPPVLSRDQYRARDAKGVDARRYSHAFHSCNDQHV